VTSVCTGAFLLGAAGLLKGRRVGEPFAFGWRNARKKAGSCAITISLRRAASPPLVDQDDRLRRSTNFWKSASDAKPSSERPPTPFESVAASIFAALDMPPAWAARDHRSFLASGRFAWSRFTEILINSTRVSSPKSENGSTYRPRYHSFARAAIARSL
jgi:hypothetical protein